MTLAKLIRVERLPPALRETIASSRFVVTGPTGWIGSAFLAFLTALMGDEVRERVSAYGSRAGILPLMFGGLPVRPLSELDGAALENRIVLHLAYVTRERIGTMPSAEYFASNLRIDQHVQDAIRQARPAGVFVASSGLAADVERNLTRDLYGMAKLVQEDTFGRLCGELEIPALILRIFNISGPFANKPEHYALANFLLQGLQRQRIVINAKGLVFRSFLDVLDLVAVVAGTLAQGRSASGVVDACGPHVVEMSEIAEEAARAIGLDLANVVRPEHNPAATSFYLGNPVRFASLAARCGLRLASFPQQVEAQAEALRRAPLSAK